MDTEKGVNHFRQRPRAARLSDGLDVLEARKLVVWEPDGRSTYQLTNFGEGHVRVALPAKPLYDRYSAMPMFDDFHLRKAAELDGLKFYLELAARHIRERHADYL